MRRLIIYTGNFSEPAMSAAGKRVYGVSRILEDLGFDVLLIGKDKNNNGMKRITEHISFISFPDYNVFSCLRYYKFLVKMINMCDVSPSCIIRYGSPCISFFDFILYIGSKKRKIKTVSDVVDWLYVDSNNVLFRLFKTVDTYMEKAIFNKHSDGIISISSYLTDYYKRKCANIITIPPVVDKQSENASNNIETRFVYAGIPFRRGQKVKNVHRIKDRLDLAVKAFYLIKQSGNDNFSFCIYGMTREEYLTAFPSHLNYVDIPNIHFYGTCEMSEVMKSLKNSDFSLLLREKNRATMAGFPTKIVESISCGTPVVTTNTSDLSSYVENGINGFFVDIESEEQLISSLQMIISMNVVDKKTMKDHCYHLEAFSYSHFIEGLDAFLKAIGVH